MPEAKEWYYLQGDKSKGRSKKVKSILYALIFFLFIRTILGSILIFSLVDMGPIFSEKNFLILYQFLIVLGLLILVVFAYKKQKNTFKKNINKKLIRPLDIQKYPALQQLISELITRMSDKQPLKQLPLDLWASKSNTFLPSIEFYNGKYNLVLPMNFFVLLNRDKKIAEGFIAHELGHVLQKDTDLWHFNSVLSGAVKNFVFPLFFTIVLITIAGSVITGTYTPDFSSIVLILITGYAYTGFRVSHKSRLLSEELADFAVYLYADIAAYKTGLATYLSNITVPSGNHPDKEIRLRLLEKNILKFSGHAKA